VQDLGIITLEPFPEPVTTEGTLSWRPAESASVVGYSIYRSGQRLNTTVVTDHSYPTPEGSLRLVLRGGHESVRTSQQPAGPEHKNLPYVSAFSFSPNPFMAQTEIQYQVSVRGRVALKVYDASGRLIRILTEQTHDPGYYRTIWDAKDETGRVLPSGVYFMTFAAANHGKPDCTVVKKAVLVGK
jgi:hypothetical protein